MMGISRIGIIGCGLIGGSFGLAIKRRRPDTQIICFDQEEHIFAINDAGVGDTVVTMDHAPELLPQCDLVYLATPVVALLELLEVIAPYLMPSAIVTDVGSTKTQIMTKAREILPAEVAFIGGHPMAGSERAGISAADPLLFNQRVYFLCPDETTPPDAMLALLDLVEDLMALPVTIEPEEHDRIVATISHMPQLLAVALMHTALRVDQTHGMLETVAGRGFLDLTRIAASDYKVWKGIFKTNLEAIGEAFSMLQSGLDEVRSALETDNLETIWEQVSGSRRKMGVESLPRLRKPDLRKLIDQYDEALLKALGNRMRVVKKIGKLKSDRNTPVHDPAREQRVLTQRAQWAAALDLPDDLVMELFEVIMNHSKKMQSEKPTES